MNEYLLKTYDLTKQYGHMKAVNQINLHLKKGAIYGLIGRNGAGKTTFLKLISGLAAPTSGEIELFGYRKAELRYVRSRIGCLIEEPGLYKTMTARENLRIKCKLFGIDDANYIEKLLRTVGLADTGKKQVKNFSLGMKQRLGIALALIGEPDLLILDEPINGLDPQGIAEIRETLLRLNEEQQITILISSHILEELEKLVTHYGIIHHGTLIQELTKEELLQRCSERIELILDEPRTAIPILDQMNFTNYEVVDESRIHIYERLDESGAITMELSKHGILIRSISVQSQKLESYFLNLTGGAAHV